MQNEIHSARKSLGTLTTLAEGILSPFGVLIEAAADMEHELKAAKEKISLLEIDNEELRLTDD